MRDPLSARFDERWHRCKASIGQQISPEDAATWLAHLHLEEVQPDRVVLAGIPNSFFRQRIAERYRPLILASLRDMFPDVGFAGEPRLELRVGSWAAEPVGHAARAAPAQTPAEEGWEARLTFATFVAAEGNRCALDFARQAARQPGTRFNPLLLIGRSGLGKSHLLHATAHALREADPAARVLCVAGEAFKNEVLDGITRKRMPQLREHYRSADALLLDDLEFLLISPKAQEELLHTFDVLHRARKQLVFTADRLPRALTGLIEPLRSRLEAGLIAELELPDAQARLEVVRHRAAEEGLSLPDDAAELLATRITHSLRRLEGAVVRLSAYGSLTGQPLTREFAERCAEPFFDTRPDGPALPVARDAILERVADRFGVTVRALKGRSRSPNLAGARRIAAHLLKHLGECSYSEIGVLLGNRSHSTMVHAHQGLMADMDRNPRLLQTVQGLTRELGEA